MRGKSAVLCSLLVLTGWPLSLYAQDVLPDEVVQFIEQRTLCDHFRGEPWPEGGSQEEQERRAFLSTQIGQLCSGSDERLRLLKERYRGDQKVVEALEGFELSIEAR